MGRYRVKILLRASALALAVALTVNAKLQLDSWQHIQVTSAGAGVFALDMKDMTGDGYADIVAGQYFYRNPGGTMTGKWEQVKFPNNISGYLILTIPGEKLPVVFGGICMEQYLLTPESQSMTSWKAFKLGTAPVCNHSAMTQGALRADIFKNDGKTELLVTERTSTTGAIYAFSIPSTPRSGAWPVLKIAGQSNGEGIAAADVDGNGTLDLFGGIALSGNGGTVVWWKNPGTESANWTKTVIGTANSKYAERFASADIDSDGKPDVIITEENGGTALDCYIHWFRNPGTPNGQWVRHNVNPAPRNGTFGMSVADMDGDGDPDIITGENGRNSFDGKEETTIWENINKGESFLKHVVALGKESHHGSRVFDMDGDGDLDIVSIGFDQYRIVNLFRNDAIRSSTAAPGLHSRANARMSGNSGSAPLHMINGRCVKSRVQGFNGRAGSSLIVSKRRISGSAVSEQRQ